jgi:stress response protein SCP2
MNDRLLVPVVMQVNEGGFTEDETPPTLVEFDLNMTSHEISFVFSETVSRDDFSANKVIIVGTNSETYNLTRGAMISSQAAYSTVLVWKMDDTDTNELKRLQFTAVSRASSGIFMEEGAVLDANGRPIPEFAVVHPCNIHTPDGTPPRLNSYDFDLTAGTITMRFSETIKSSSLVAVGLQVLAARDATLGLNGVALTGGSLKVDLDADADASTKSDWLTAVIALSEVDMNAIKKRVGLAVGGSTTFLTISSVVITDMNDQPVEAIDAALAMRVSETGFKDDQVNPELRSFALDMSNRLLTLSFSETMLASSIVMDAAANRLVFYNGNNGTTVSLQPSSVNVDGAGEDTDVITLQLSEADANAMKIAGIGRNSADVDSSGDLKMYSGWAYDMNNNAVQTTDAALIPDNFIADTVAPVMRSATVDMNAGTLTIVFDETVKADSLASNTITVQSDAAGTVKHTLQGPGINLNSANSPTIVVKIEDDDLNAIKLKEMLTALGDSYIYLAEGTVTDTSVAETASVARGNDAAAPYTVDTTDPKLTDFSFDLTTKAMILTFDEVVKASSIVESNITLWSHASQAAADALSETRNFWRLDKVTVVSENGLEIELRLSDEDLDNIKAIENLYVSPTSAYLAVTAVTDMALPPRTVVPVLDTAAMVAGRFKSDNVRPKIIQVDLNMTSELLTIFFSETVDSSSIVYEGITLQKGSNVGSAVGGHVSLKGGSRTHTTDLTSLQIKLNTDDLNRMKTAKIGMNAASSYLVMTAASLKDMAGLPVIPREDGVAGEGGPLQVTVYEPDKTDPVLEKCALDLTAETMTLSFSETVKADSILVKYLTLAEDQAGAQTKYSLHAPSGTLDKDGPEIVVDISLTDMNEIKRLSELGLATKVGGASTVHCSVSTLFITDVFENPVAVRDVSDGLLSTDFKSDVTPPRLSSFNFDMNQVVSENTVQVATSTILFKFSETVKFSSYEPTAVTIQKATTVAGSGSSVTLEGEFAAVSVQSGTTLSFKLLRNNTNAIKAIADLATDASNTYITLTSGFVEDMYGNPIVSVDNGAARKVSNDGYTQDSTEPELLRFDIDMDEGKLTLSFDETVTGMSINPDEIVIRDTTVAADSAASFALTGGVALGGEPWVKSANGARTFPHPDSHVITFYFTKADLDEIKRLDMCNEANDCFLVHTEFLVYDMKENNVIRCT